MNVQIEESWKAHLEPEFEKELAKSGEAYSFEWDFDYTLSPVYNRNDFFCYGVSSSEYTGGAHGMYSNRVKLLAIQITHGADQSIFFTYS